MHSTLLFMRSSLHRFQKENTLLNTHTQLFGFLEQDKVTGLKNIHSSTKLFESFHSNILHKPLPMTLWSNGTEARNKLGALILMCIVKDKNIKPLRNTALEKLCLSFVSFFFLGKIPGIIPFASTYPLFLKGLPHLNEYVTRVMFFICVIYYRCVTLKTFLNFVCAFPTHSFTHVSIDLESPEKKKGKRKHYKKC